MTPLQPRIQRKTRLRRSVLAMAATAVILILTLAAAVFVTGRLYRDAHQWTLHSYQVREQILELVGDLQLAEMDARGYGLTGRDTDFQQYWHHIATVDRDATQLAGLVADNPAEIAHADVIALVSQPTRPAREIAEAMLDREATLLAQREKTSDRYGKRVALVAAFALFGCLTLLLAALVNSGIERRRRQRGDLELERNALHLQRALQDANRSSETLRRLSTLAELLQNCRDLDEAINVIERALPPLLPDVSGALALINASRNIVEARMHWGLRGSDLGGSIFAPDDCWALRRSQPHPGDDDHTAPVCPHLTQAGVTADHTLCLPLNSQGQVLGVLSLCAPAVIALDTRRLAMTAADQLALALANLQLQASLRTQSIRDPLTNLFNRRYLEASLPRELLRAERRKGGLSVLMFDLDHFKRYNDTQGHDAGDALLSAFGALLAQSCRGEDMPCRFGGEEFTLVLTDA